MRKYINVTTSRNEDGGLNINVKVLNGAVELNYFGAGGYIEAGDLDDLTTPARMMVQQLTGEQDEELIEKLADAFQVILTPPPVNTVSIDGERFA